MNDNLCQGLNDVQMGLLKCSTHNFGAKITKRCAMIKVVLSSMMAIATHMFATTNAYTRFKFLDNCFPLLALVHSYLPPNPN